MAQDGSSAPRRALGPLPDEPAGGSRSGGRFAADDDALTNTGRLRRLAASPASPVSPLDPLEVPARTPVPPPAPVLPDSGSALPASAGRRFSASAEPGEFTPAAPRRSAASPLSPSSAMEPVLPPVTRPTTPPAGATSFTPSPFGRPAAGTAATVPFSPGPVSPIAPPPSAPAMVPPAGASLAATVPSPGEPAPAETAEETAPTPKRRLFGRRRKPDATAPSQGDVAPEGDAAPAPSTAAATTTEPGPDAEPARTTGAATRGRTASRRSARPALLVIAAVLVVALLVAGGVWLLTLRSNAPSGGPTNSTTAPALDPLVTAADLGTLGGVTWTESTGSSDEARPICLPAADAGLPAAARTITRRTPATTDTADALVQVVDTYAEESEAVQAYAVRVGQAGTCADTEAWLTGANAVTGLADGAVAVRFIVQDQSDVFHTLLVSRTGRSVSLTDLTTTRAAVPALELANVVGRALSRQCGVDLGTCPASIGVESTPPPAGAPAGWLVEADLPRVTPGAGRWGAIDPAATVSIPGSQCEAVNLETVSGTLSAGQRTLLLADDPDAPQGFGVDMVTYTFADADAATRLANKLTRNIGGCADRAPTATVAEGPAVKGTGEAGAKVSGSTFLVTQKTETATVVYRVAVLSVGTRVVYLLGNPTQDFDFTEAEWKAVSVRAGQRATQA